MSDWIPALPGPMSHERRITDTARRFMAGTPSRFSRLRRLIHAPLLAVALVLTGPSALAQQPRKVIVLDHIVAVVNNEVITRADLDEQTRTAMLALKQQGTP